MIIIDSIATVFEEFKYFFKDNNLPVYYVLERQDNNLDHDHSFMDIQDIKNFIMAVKPQFIQLQIDKFEIDNDLKAELLTTYEEKKRFKELSSELQSINNSFIALTVTLPLSLSSNPSFGFVCDRFNDISEYISLSNEIIQNEKDFGYEEEEEEDYDKIEIKNLSKDDTEGYINRLISEAEFISTSIEAHRRDYIFEFFENELNSSNIAELIPKAERALEKHLKNRIAELKKQGKRKFEIPAELGISKHRVDKYF